MLTSSELKKIPVFACLNDANLVWLSQQAADLHLEPGEYLIHEGEPTPFFVVMGGTTEVLKDVMGRQTEVSEHKPRRFLWRIAHSHGNGGSRLRPCEDSLPLGKARSSTAPGIDSTLARVQRVDLTDPERAGTGRAEVHAESSLQSRTDRRIEI